MDIRLYTRVLWRFKWVVLLGLLIALALATLSMARVTTDGKVSYRQSELWSSTTRLGVTQQGFPWGRLLAQQEPTPDEQAERLGIPLADPNRLNTLAVLYAELATSDPVRRQMIEDGGPLRGKIIATPVVVGENRVMLPFVDVLAIATTPRGASRLAQRAADAFGVFMNDQQRANKVPRADRVVVQQLVRPMKPKLFQPRSKTMPVVVFFAVMFGTFGLAFLLENLRPRAREVEEPAEPEFRGAARRTA
jgi:hypothetical protein